MTPEALRRMDRDTHRTTAQLSAAERSRVNDAMIAQIGQLTTQVNALTARANDHEHRLTTLQRHHEAARTTLMDFYHRSFWQRLRWLVTGR